MPSLKVFTNTSKSLSDADLETLNDVVISGLKALGEHAVIVVVPDAKVNLSGCYVELTCRHKANRTPEMLQALAHDLDRTARDLFSLNVPVRVRIIMVEEKMLGAVN